MESRRTLVVVVAIVLAVVAGVAVFLYLGSQREEADKNKVEVLVAKKAIPRNTTAEAILDQRLYKKEMVETDLLVTGALTSVDALEQLRGRVTLSDLAPKQQLVENQFITPGSGGGSFSGLLEPGEGKQAIAISATGEKAVAGSIVAGDHINVIVFSAQEAAPGEVSTGQSAYMLQNIKVITAGGQTTVTTPPAAGAPSSNTASSSGLFVLEVDPIQALKLVQAINGGGVIWLTLVPPDYEPQPIPLISGRDLFDSDNVVGAPEPVTIPPPPSTTTTEKPSTTTTRKGSSSSSSSTTTTTRP